METQGTEAVELEVQITLEDYALFNTWHSRHLRPFLIVYAVTWALVIMFALGLPAGQDRLFMQVMSLFLPALALIVSGGPAGPDKGLLCKPRGTSGAGTVPGFRTRPIYPGPRRLRVTTRGPST